MKVCPKCSTEFEDKFNFCRHDGTALQGKALAKLCPGCGKETEKGKRFCRYCGARLESDPADSDPLVDHAGIDLHVPKADPGDGNLLAAQFPPHYATDKTRKEMGRVGGSC